MMKQFAIYHIPSNNDLYKKGNEIIGYDILNQSVIDSVNRYYQLTKNLNYESMVYGFHLTLTDVVEIDEERFNKAMQRAEFIFKLSIFRGIRIEKDKIDIMPNAKVLAIQYKSNLKLFLLHFLLIIFVQRLGFKSHYSDHVHDLSLFQKIKTKLFLSPYIIDDFLPHLSLVQNFMIKQHKEVFQYIKRTFKDDEYLEIRQIAIVTKEPSEMHFKVLKLLG